MIMPDERRKNMSLFSKNRQVQDFETLATAHEKQVYLTCLHMMGNREDALDCVQETMLKAYRAFSSFRGESQFSTWLSRIAMNVCTDALRKRKAVYSLDALREDGFDPEDSRAALYARLDARERMRLLKEALLLLPPDMKTILILRDVEGRSMAEIAQVLNLPQGTVKSRLSRAREKLCKILSKNAELFASASV